MALSIEFIWARPLAICCFTFSNWGSTALHNFFAFIWADCFACRSWAALRNVSPSDFSIFNVSPRVLISSPPPAFEHKFFAFLTLALNPEIWFFNLETSPVKSLTALHSLLPLPLHFAILFSKTVRLFFSISFSAASSCGSACEQICEAVSFNTFSFSAFSASPYTLTSSASDWIFFIKAIKFFLSAVSGVWHISSAMAISIFKSANFDMIVPNRDENPFVLTHSSLTLLAHLACKSFIFLTPGSIWFFALSNWAKAMVQALETDWEAACLKPSHFTLKSFKACWKAASSPASKATSSLASRAFLSCWIFALILLTLSIEESSFLAVSISPSAASSCFNPSSKFLSKILKTISFLNLKASRLYWSYSPCRLAMSALIFEPTFSNNFPIASNCSFLPAIIELTLAVILSFISAFLVSTWAMTCCWISLWIAPTSGWVLEAVNSACFCEPNWSAYWRSSDSIFVRSSATKGSISAFIFAFNSSPFALILDSKSPFKLSNLAEASFCPQLENSWTKFSASAIVFALQIFSIFFAPSALIDSKSGIETSMPNSFTFSIPGSIYFLTASRAIKKLPLFHLTVAQ